MLKSINYSQKTLVALLQYVPKVCIKKHLLHGVAIIFGDVAFLDKYDTTLHRFNICAQQLCSLRLEDAKRKQNFVSQVIGGLLCNTMSMLTEKLKFESSYPLETLILRMRLFVILFSNSRTVCDTDSIVEDTTTRIYFCQKRRKLFESKIRYGVEV